MARPLVTEQLVDETIDHWPVHGEEDFERVSELNEDTSITA